MPQEEDRPPASWRATAVLVKDFVWSRPHLLPSLIAAAMLFAAWGKWPYDYYTIMRWVVCAAAVFTAWQGYRFKDLWATWVFGASAILFNPLAPVHFARATWQVLDVVMAVVFLAGAASVHSGRRISTNESKEGC